MTEEDAEGKKAENEGCLLRPVLVSLVVFLLVRLGAKYILKGYWWIKDKCPGDYSLDDLMVVVQTIFGKFVGSSIAWMLALGILVAITVDIVRGCLVPAEKSPVESGWHVMVGRFRGAPVYLHLTLILFLVGPLACPGDWMTRLSVLGVVVLSILFHELTHAGVGHDCGNRIRSVKVFFWGGLCRFETKEVKCRIFVHLAGPVANLALAFVALVAGTHFGLAEHPIVRCAVMLNTSLFLLNMLPGYPFDGGHIWNGVLSRIFPEHKLLVLVIGGGLSVIVLSVRSYMAFSDKSYPSMVICGVLAILVFVVSAFFAAQLSESRKGES